MRGLQDLALRWRPDPINFEVSAKDIILYALSVGVSTMEKDALRFIYENDDDFAPIPTFGVIVAQEALGATGAMTGAMPGFSFDLTRLLHGEQHIEIYKALPTCGKLAAHLRVVDILDKKSGALIIINVDVLDEAEDKVLSAQYALFIVGAGGFGGKRTSEHIVPTADAPQRPPDASLQYKTSADQAALYRLCGDRNPLHIDPNFAAMGGFKQPILHGLCSYGIACRQVLQQYADNDVHLFKSMKARFASPVLPGQTLQTNMWREGDRIHIVSKVLETGKSVLTGAYIDLKSVKPAVPDSKL